MSKTWCAVATSLMILSASPALAFIANCSVADPTGTRLNVRTGPDGPVVGTLRNLEQVQLLAVLAGKRGRLWAYVSSMETNRPIGWVYRDYIDCL